MARAQAGELPTTNPPLVTIVIPTHDDDPLHLGEALGSALAQTHPRLEVVVVDDGSSRPETVSALDDLTTVPVLRQVNRGPSAARNAGIATGTGDIIICLDADDVLSPTYAAEAAALLSADDVCRAAYPRVDPFGDIPWPAWPTRGPLELAAFAQRSAIPVSSAFRRMDWQLVGGWDEHLRVGMEDHEWWVRLLGSRGGHALPMPTATLHYRVRAESRSRQRPYADDLAVTRQHILDNNGSETIRELLVGAWMATDSAEAEAARAWSDRWQLRRWTAAAQRRIERVVGAGQQGGPPSALG